MYRNTCVACFLILNFFICRPVNAQSPNTVLEKRQRYLDQIIAAQPPELPERGHVSRLDATWRDWLRRTGELPPDFDSLPSIPNLPDPLMLDEGGENIPVTTLRQWQMKREWISRGVRHWITGTFPPPPDNLRANIISREMDGDVTVSVVELRFGPEHKAKMTVKLIVPPGEGPFPVFMAQWNHIGWALIAVRRGYIGCLYAGADAKDDTETYADIWYPEYDFTRLMRRAWGAHRVVDYLYTLPFVDKNKIALTGHSRNGKQSLMAAAFDERISAVISSSGGTGAENPWRFTNDIFDNESIDQMTVMSPYWFHPRLRFFAGREHKLPVDQNLLMALIAPRGLMLSSAFTETQGNPWGIEQNYRSLEKVYRFLGMQKNLSIRLRPGRHDTAPRDIESYMDFFDYVFDRGNIEPPNHLYYDYSFGKWLGLSGEYINPLDYPEKSLGDILSGTEGGTIKTEEDWERKKSGVMRRITWSLGIQPPETVQNKGPEKIENLPHDDPSYSYDHIARVIERPSFRKGIGRMIIGHYSSFGEYLDGNLYYPADENGEPAGNNLPVIIYLHEFAYPTGFARNSAFIIKHFVELGYAVFLFDQVGFGTRVGEGTLFYQRYPHWSKMGKMVSDTRAAVEAMSSLEIIDDERIYAAGYSLGATVSLYAASLDNRIKGVIAAGGFTPLRTAGDNKDITGLTFYSHLHGLMPRLGFFDGEDSRLPFDFYEIIASIAPRPLLVIEPSWNRFASINDVRQCVEESGKIYRLYDAGDNLELFAPEHHSILTIESWGFKYTENVGKKLNEWIPVNFK